MGLSSLSRNTTEGTKTPLLAQERKHTTHSPGPSSWGKAITNGSEHNKVLEARMMDRNDGGVIEINQVVDRRAEASRWVAQRSNEALHIEHGKSPARNDAFTFAVMQQWGARALLIHECGRRVSCARTVIR